MHELTQFFAQAQHHTGNEDIGLLAYQSAHPGHLGALGYAVMSCPTLHDALARIAEHHAMIGTGFSMFLDVHPTTLKISGLSTASQSPSLPRAFIDAVAAITLGLLHWLAPSARIQPVQAEFTYRQPADTRQLEQLFGSNLRFSATVNTLTFRRSDGDLPVATSDPLLQQIHDEYLKRRQSELHSATTTARVKRIIVQHLSQGRPLTLGDIARTLDSSAHQLTRALDKEGQRFQSLLDLVRQQQSRHLLLNTTLSLKQIAYRMGFKNQSAFNKACERWFAMSPGRYRSNPSSTA
ncbi:AraC family transcriptional regulator [Pseudomonas sp. NPDC090202]|uniref:AraC family transcriptional regulator n=1 Tax=unclassified Pseudomonas TaxID=196821 RepID=UPI0037F781FE